MEENMVDRISSRKISDDELKNKKSDLKLREEEQFPTTEQNPKKRKRSAPDPKESLLVKNKNLLPFWNDECLEISKKLWLATIFSSIVYMIYGII